jgi:hypothetical protein
MIKHVSKADAEKRLEAISMSLFESIGTPKALAAFILLREKEYEQLVTMDANPLDYLTAEQFADDYLVVKFLSKFPNFKHLDLQPEAVARQSFESWEIQCKSTNQKFRRLREDPSLWDPFERDVLNLAKRKISRVLGSPDLDEIAGLFGWGPGATSVSRGHLTSAYVKFSQRLDVTENSLIMGQCCVNSTPAWVNCQLQTDAFPSVEVSLTREAFNVVKGNEVVFVPKNAKTHRVIAKEPHVNSYLQKGFGKYLRRRLRTVAGVDLSDQTRNQRLARHGSLTGELATIDLSGASDTISFELVRELLPSPWFGLLEQIRSRLGRLDDSWFYYEKFSSMGNAYTFELESLIFWALSDAVLELEDRGRTIGVYGDDIIVPSSSFDTVARILVFCGFTLNVKKSFSSGPFRESCGQDFFLGINVRPIFLKEDISNVESLYRLANSLRRYAHRRRFNNGCDDRILRTWKAILSYIPKAGRNFVPEGFGDVGLIGNFDEATPSLARRERGWEGFFFKALVRSPVKRRMIDGHAGYTALLSAIGEPRSNDENEREDAEFISAVTAKDPLRIKRSLDLFDARYSESPSLGFHNLRDMTRPKVARIHTHGWYDLGPWQ